MAITVTRKKIMWNYMGMVMTLGSNLLLLPFMLAFLNGDELGLWYVFISIGSVVTLFDFGFAPTLARNIAYCWSGAIELNKTGVTFVAKKEANLSLLIKVIATCKRIYLIIAVLALLVMTTIGTYYILYVSKDLIGNKHLISWFIYSAAIFLNLYYGYYTTFLLGIGAISQSNIANIISRSFQIVISIVLLFFGFGLIAITVAYFANGLLFRLISKNLFYRYEKLGERIKNSTEGIKTEDIREIFKVIWHNAWRDGLVTLSNYLSTQASIIICSLYIGLTETGIYALSVQLITAIGAISGNLYGTCQPSLQAAYITNDVDKSRKIMSTAMTVYIILFFLGIIALITVGIPILSFIKPETVFNIPIFMAISVYIFLSIHHSYYASYISNTNNVPYANAFLISSFLGVVLSIVLINVTKLGVWGVIISQIIVQLVYNNWKWPYVVMKNLKINPAAMFEIGFGEIKKKVKYRL